MKSVEEDLIVQELRRGEQAAVDEGMALVMAKGGVAVTLVTSPWLFQICPECLHTFRVGDEVEVELDKSIRHAGSRGQCLCELAGTADPAGEAARFYEGLNEAWPAPEEFHILRLEPGHELLARPRGATGRRSCAICAHTFRPNDLVVICPCSPAEPLCAAAIHRDVIHNMTCWDAWNPDKVREYCPVTSRRLDE